MPQIVPAVDAALDIASVCVVVITRGLDFVCLESSSVEYLAQVASCDYRLLPYAIEFWIEHCSQYASAGGSLDKDRIFQHHLARMHDKHKDRLHALGHATACASTHDNSSVSYLDERLGLFLNTPIYALMTDILNLRKSARLDGDKGSGRLGLNSSL
jgi:hypothetical protein